MRLSHRVLAPALFLSVLTFAHAQESASGLPKGYFSGDPLPPATIYLTFDDGPAPETAQILDVLKDKGVKATFFLNAFDRHLPAREIAKSNRFIEYKDVLERMVAEGHVLGNHTFSHRDLATLTTDQINWQLDMVQKCLDDALGVDSPRLTLMRPPFGSPWLGRWATPEQRSKVAAVMTARGLTVINWTNAWDSSDSIDWVNGESQRLTKADFVPTADYTNKQNRELHRLLAHADGQTSAVILFHDTHPTSLDILAEVIDKYKALGYTFATMDQYSQWRWKDQTPVSPTPDAAPRP